MVRVGSYKNPISILLHILPSLFLSTFPPQFPLLLLWYPLDWGRPLLSSGPSPKYYENVPSLLGRDGDSLYLPFKSVSCSFLQLSYSHLISLLTRHLSLVTSPGRRSGSWLNFPIFGPDISITGMWTFVLPIEESRSFQKKGRNDIQDTTMYSSLWNYHHRRGFILPLKLSTLYLLQESQNTFKMGDDTRCLTPGDTRITIYNQF